MDNESCYAAIRLTQKGQPTQNVPLTYPRKKFDPRKITHAKLSVKRTHDPRKFTHDPRKVTHVPRPTQLLQPTQLSTLSILTSLVKENANTFSEEPPSFK